ncbi:sensor histidine kinase [Oleidesulfovibrio sp.]|uniref:sensor histidine kinase n=1 Tax=Oleidesulfovibrio sp. TaxID=2909707 RepID=UPI003A86A877
MLPANPLLIETILARMPVGVMIIGADGNIAQTNPALTGMLGIPMHEMLGKGWAELFMAEGNNLEFNQVIVDVIHKELEFLSRSVAYVDPAGTERELGILSCFIKQSDEVAGIVLLFQDVTELARMHAAERHMFKEMLRLEREREEGLRILASAVAHQVRNPNTVIGGVAGMLQRQYAEDAPLSRMLDVIRQETFRLEAMVTEVSSFAAISASEPQLIHWDSFLESWAAARRVQSGEAHIEVRGNGMQSVVFVDLLTLVLDELYDNARRFATTDRGLLVKLDVVEEGGWAALYMQDNGKGLDLTTLPFLFDPFFTSRSDGVGMGLCKVRRCMMVHGGTIEAGNVPQGGARFIMRFPPRTLELQAGPKSTESHT